MRRSLTVLVVLVVGSAAHADWTVNNVYRRVTVFTDAEFTSLLGPDTKGCGEEFRLRLAPQTLELVADQDSCFTQTRLYHSTIAQAQQVGDLARTAAWMDFTIDEATTVRFLYSVESPGVFRFQGPNHDMLVTEGNNPWGIEPQILQAGVYYVSLDATVTDGERFVGSFEIQEFVIPEPSMWALAAVGLVVLWAVRRHRR